MYTMTVDGRPLFDPRVCGYGLERPTLTQDANKFATLTFNIYPNHPEYAKINKRSSIIAVYVDGEIILKMRPVKSKLTFRGGVEYYCEELAARLNDIKRRPSYYSGTPEQFIGAVLSDFNSRYSGATPGTSGGYTDINVPLVLGNRGEDVRKMQSNLLILGFRLPRYGVDGEFGDETAVAVKAFKKAYGLTVNAVFDSEALQKMVEQFVDPSEEEDTEAFYTGTVAGVSTDSAEFINDDYVGYWDLLQEKLVKALGGYLVPRYAEDRITLDYVTEAYLPLSAQEIVFGKNLVDLFIQTDAANTFSVLIPLGADVRATNIHAGQAKNTPLTISSVNSGKDYIENSYGLNLYGRKEFVQRWEEVKDATELKRLGAEYLKDHAVMLSETITLNAVDLRDAGVNVSALKWMTRIRVTDDHFSVDEQYPLTKKQTPLGRPGDAKIQLGTTKDALTDRISGNVEQAAQEYSRLNGRVFNIENPDQV